MRCLQNGRFFLGFVVILSITLLPTAHSTTFTASNLGTALTLPVVTFANAEGPPTIASGQAGRIARVTIGFVGDGQISTGDTVVAVLPGFHFANNLDTPSLESICCDNAQACSAPGSAAASGGSIDFAVKHANSGTADAAVTFTATGGKLVANKGCGIIMPVGVTLPNGIYDSGIGSGVGLGVATLSISMSDPAADGSKPAHTALLPITTAGIAARIPILSNFLLSIASTPENGFGMAFSGRPNFCTPYEPCEVSVTFKSDTAMEIGDKLRLELSYWGFKPGVDPTIVSGCGTTAFSTVVPPGTTFAPGTKTAAVDFVVKGAVLPAGTFCHFKTIQSTGSTTYSSAGTGGVGSAAFSNSAPDTAQITYHPAARPLSYAQISDVATRRELVTLSRAYTLTDMLPAVAASMKYTTRFTANSKSVGPYVDVTGGAVGGPLLTIGTPAHGKATSLSIFFVAGRMSSTEENSLWPGAKIVVTLPFWTLTGTASPTVTSCASTPAGGDTNTGTTPNGAAPQPFPTFTSSVTHSGTVHAAVTFTLTSGSWLDCTLVWATGATAWAGGDSPTVCEASKWGQANLRERTIAIYDRGLMPDVPPTPFVTSTAVVPTVVASDYPKLVVLTPYVASPTMLSFEFASKSKKLAINDKIKLVLPAWTLTGSAAPTTSAGCGTTTFTATVGNTGTAEANIVFTATSAALLAGSSCTLTWPTGATTPASAQTADTSAYTYELILAGGTIAAAPIPKSTATTAPVGLHSTSLTFATMLPSSPTSVTVGFACANAVEIADTITVGLPSWVLIGNTAPTTAGCGSTTFTTTVSNSGETTAAITFTARDAALAKNSMCSITLPTGATTAQYAQAANDPQRTISASLASGADTTTSTANSNVPASPAIGNQPFTDRALTVAVPYAGAPSAVTLSFKVSSQVPVSSKIILALPSWTLTAGTLPTASCGTGVSFSMAPSGSETPSAALTFTVLGAAIQANTACSITTHSSTTKVSNTAQVVNYVDRTLAATIAGGSTFSFAATPITASTATPMPSLFATSMAVAVPIARAHTAVSFGFTATVDLSPGDTITVALPFWRVYGSASPTISGCGDATFTYDVSGTNPITAKFGGSTNNPFTASTPNWIRDNGDPAAEITFKVVTSTLAANTACTLTTSPSHVIAQPSIYGDYNNYFSYAGNPRFTMRASLAQFANIAAAPIESSPTIARANWYDARTSVSGGPCESLHTMTWSFKMNMALNPGTYWRVDAGGLDTRKGGGKYHSFAGTVTPGSCGGAQFIVERTNDADPHLRFLIAGSSPLPAHTACTVTSDPRLLMSTKAKCAAGGRFPSDNFGYTYTLEFTSDSCEQCRGENEYFGYEPIRDPAEMVPLTSGQPYQGQFISKDIGGIVLNPKVCSLFFQNPVSAQQTSVRVVMTPGRVMAVGDHFRVSFPPTFVVAGTSSPGVDNCGATTFATDTTTFTQPGHKSVVFTAQVAALARDAACTITTQLATVKTPPEAYPRQLFTVQALGVTDPATDTTKSGYKCDWRFGNVMKSLADYSSEWGFTPVAVMANGWNSPTSVNAINKPAFYATSLSFAIPVKDQNSAATLSFKSTAALAAGDKITVQLPNTFVLASTADGAPALVSCGATTFTLTQQTNSIVLLLGSALSVDATCAVTTHAATIQVKTTVANHVNYTMQAENSVDIAAARIATVDAVLDSTTYYGILLTLGTFIKNAKTPITLQFRSLSAIAIGGTLVLSTPSFIFTGTAVPTTADKGGCGATTFTAATTNSGQTNAKITFTVASAGIAEKTPCALTWPVGAQMGPSPSIGNFQLGAIDVPAELSLVYNQPGSLNSVTGPYASSTAGLGFAQLVTDAVDSVTLSFFLSLSAPILGAETTVSLAFGTSIRMDPKDTIKLSLKAKWTLADATTSIPTASAGCGGSPIFSTAYAGSGNETNAAITWTVVSGYIAAYAKCTITSTAANETKVPLVPTALNTDAASPAVTITFHADNSGLPALEILGSTNLANPQCPGSNAVQTRCGNYHLVPDAIDKQVRMLIPLVDSFTPVETIFRLNVPLKQQDTIIVALPKQKLFNSQGAESDGEAAAPTVSSGTCGTTTFTATVANSSGINTTLTFKAAGADLAANTLCTITTDTNTVKAAYSLTLAESARISVVLADVANIAPASISTLANIYAAQIPVRRLSIASPFTGQPTTIKVEFKYTVEILTGQKITLKLPYFAVFKDWTDRGAILSNTGGALAPAAVPAATVTGCSALVAASVQVAYSLSEDASIEFTISGANNTANTQCALSTAHGVAVAPTSAQPANLNTRTIQLAGMTAAIPLMISAAIVDLSLGITSLTIASPTANTASSMTFKVRPSFPVAAADTLTALLPGFTFTTESPVVTATCGQLAFTAKTSGSGTTAAAILFTACGEPTGSDVDCTLTVASGVHTGGAEAANPNTRTLSYQSAVASPGMTNLPPFSNAVSAPISNSNAVLAPTPPPTQIPATLPPIAPETAAMKQSVTYGITASSYIQEATKGGYDLGYCKYTAVCDMTTNLPKTGNSKPIGTVSGRRVVQVNYVTQVARKLLPEVISATSNGNAAGLQAAINNAIATAYPNASIPAAVVTTFGAATVEVSANDDVLGTSQIGYASLTQDIAFSPSIDYSNESTALAYDKGYGKFLGIYNSAKVYLAGSSVTSYQTSRRSAKSITWVSQVPCDGLTVAYSAATGSSSSATLQAAIQAVIDDEYPAVGVASSPSLGRVALDQSQCAHSDDGLSGADIAGIVVGSVVGVLVLAGAAWYFMRVSNDAPTRTSERDGPTDTVSKSIQQVSGLSRSADTCGIERSCC